jgi:hypothetical protein
LAGQVDYGLSDPTSAVNRYRAALYAAGAPKSPGTRGESPVVKPRSEHSRRSRWRRSLRARSEKQAGAGVAREGAALKAGFCGREAGLAFLCVFVCGGVFVAAGDGEGECLGVVGVVVGGEGGGGFEVGSALGGFGVAGSAGACEL